MSQSLSPLRRVAAHLRGMPRGRAVLLSLLAIWLGACGQPALRAASASDEKKPQFRPERIILRPWGRASALVEPGPPQAAPQTPPATAGVVGLGVNGAATFDAAWQAIHDTFVHEGRSEAEWAALRDEFRPRAAAAESDAALRSVLREMLARLGRSHFDILPSSIASSSVSASAADAAQETGDVGLEITPIEGEPVVTRVVTAGPADRPAWVRGGFSRESTATIRSVRCHPLRKGPRGAERLPAVGGHARSAPGTDGHHHVGGLSRHRRAHSDPAADARGPEGQPVKLGYLPALAAHLDHRMLSAPGGRPVGYIHFNIWMTPLAPAIDRAVDASRDAAGIIIDLRQNPGGVLTMLMGVSGHFFDAPRSLGTLQTRDSELRLVANPRLVFDAGARVAPFAGRVAILVDDTSYSASEVFAGGMQAAGRARVFGVRTPGGALPALMRKLPNGDVLDTRSRTSSRRRASASKAMASCPTSRYGRRGPRWQPARIPCWTRRCDGRAEERSEPDDTRARAHPHGAGDRCWCHSRAARAGVRACRAAARPCTHQAAPGHGDPVPLHARDRRGAGDSKYRSRRAVGRFELRAQGISGPIEILAAAPNRMLIRIALSGLGPMLRGYDGTIGWSVDPAVGPRVLSGRELEETQYPADFYADIYNPADYASITVVARAPFEGHDCFTVKLVRPSGFESLEYLDAESGLRLGGRMTSTSMMGSVPDVVTVFGEYKEFGGIRMPATATQRAMGVESLLTIDRVEYTTRCATRNCGRQPQSWRSKRAKGLGAQGSRFGGD